MTVLRIIPGTLTATDALELRCSPSKRIIVCEGCGTTLDFWGNYGSHGLGCEYAPASDAPAGEGEGGAVSHPSLFEVVIEKARIGYRWRVERNGEVLFPFDEYCPTWALTFRGARHKEGLAKLASPLWGRAP